MRIRSRLGLTLLLAASTLAILAHAALASRLSFVPSERGFKLVFPAFTLHAWTGEGFEEHEIQVACPVTLEGTFAGRSFAKAPRLQYATVTRAAVTEASCTGRRTFWARNERELWIIATEEIPGKLHWLTETLPWPLEYQAFQGVLPVITSIIGGLTRVAVRVNELPLGGECLFGGTMGHKWIVESRGLVTSFIGVETSRPLELRSSNFFCLMPEALYSGAGTVTQSDGRTTIALRLI
ncbi:MAG TPA: hypothetical protein VFG31_03290 [Conexibacter sp.]|nr:hypothetical protein [Conexibacter sp.]